MLTETEDHGVIEDVERGATLLDEKMPDWPFVLDTRQLSVSDPSHCVVTQLTGNYGSTLDAWGVGHLHDTHNACDYGFCCDTEEDDEYREAWEQARARRAR